VRGIQCKGDMVQGRHGARETWCKGDMVQGRHGARETWETWCKETWCKGERDKAHGRQGVRETRGEGRIDEV
jgi:hypothetical protein